MPPSDRYRPDPRFEALGQEFADPVRAARFPTHVLRLRNARAAEAVGLDTLSDEEWTAAFARFEPLPGNQPEPLAMRYHGHQFRTYNPNLGDGRGFLFAQMRDGAGRLLDLGTKGSGQTPYSRFGDGRLTLKGGVREALASAMLEALGVPTSRALALFETGEALERHDEPSPTRAAVLTRLSHSHIRFGTFQRHAYLGRPDLVQALIDHGLQTYFPALWPIEPDRSAAALLRAVTERCAHLTARWMAAGFVHGVLNTDNMNITGESFDYGPYRFLPRNDPSFTAAYFDETGLYCFGRQPEAVFWNLQQLGAALAATGCPREPLVEALEGFGEAYSRALTEAVIARLGVKPRSAEQDQALAGATFEAIAEAGEPARWEPFFFDWFGGSISEARAGRGPRAGAYGGPAARAFRDRLAAYEAAAPERLDLPYFQAAEPEELLYDEIEAIWARIDADDDWSLFERKLARIDQARLAWGLGANF
ncbi:MAG TPA: YdiU family protein [Caulobacteraceae bacterium]|nr:YdiU family protein [Caulobacteraceae bacterium]